MGTHNGIVCAVYATPDVARFETCGAGSLTVDLQGIPGDRHYGFIRPAGAREPWFKRGEIIRSGRQISLVSAEELARIAQIMDVPQIDPGWIGANVLISGIADFTRLAWGSRLFFGEGAVLVNEGENVPCRYAGAAIARHYPDRPDLDRAFVKAAKHLRGIVASVERAGDITPGPLLIKCPTGRNAGV
ncbi:MAG: MOSC domain-containing protein [Acidocella sp.]|nr:MOSC domain-containing protein [Acidocella sp.]